MTLKNGCYFISNAPLYPNLVWGFRSKRPNSKFLASLDNDFGNVSFELLMLLYSVMMSFEKNGGSPTIDSYRTAPKAIEVTFLANTQMIWLRTLFIYLGRFLLSPKSTSLTCPFSSSIMFYGLRSRYIMFLLCRYSKAKSIYAAYIIASFSGESDLIHQMMT